MNTRTVILQLIVLFMAFTSVSAASSDLTISELVEHSIVKLSSSDFRERNEGSRTLVRIGLPAVKPLISALRGDDRELRWKSALVLGKIRAPDSVPPLLDAMSDRYWVVRFWAAWSLGEIKDKRAVQPLIGLLNDSELLVVRMAHDSLREITGESFGRDPARWEHWLNQ